jgi:hypothetical protein
VSLVGLIHSLTAKVSLNDDAVSSRSIFGKKVIALNDVKSVNFYENSNLEILSIEGGVIKFPAKAKNMRDFVPELVNRITQKKELLVNKGAQALIETHPEDQL